MVYNIRTMRKPEKPKPNRLRPVVAMTLRPETIEALKARAHDTGSTFSATAEGAIVAGLGGLTPIG